MVTTIDILYKGQLRCEAVHGPSKQKVETDAPVDNHGKGQRFSPTDLVATALGSCFLTMMGITAEQKDVNMKGAKAYVEKHMSTGSPRKIIKLVVHIDMPAGITFHWRGLLEAVARECPVSKSISPDIKIDLQFNYPD